MARFKKATGKNTLLKPLNKAHAAEARLARKKTNVKRAKRAGKR